MKVNLRDIYSMSRGNVFAKNRRKPSKLRSIKGLVVCSSWDLEPLDLLNGLVINRHLIEV